MARRYGIAYTFNIASLTFTDAAADVHRLHTTLSQFAPQIFSTSCLSPCINLSARSRAPLARLCRVGADADRHRGADSVGAARRRPGVDALVAGTLHGAALMRELISLLIMGSMIYLLRVGWRLQLFSAAYQLGVELRTRLYDRLTLQGPPFFNRSRTGDLMARATNDVDSIEMAAGEAFSPGSMARLL